jgi:hypothetical protein
MKSATRCFDCMLRSVFYRSIEIIRGLWEQSLSQFRRGENGWIVSSGGEAATRKDSFDLARGCGFDPSGYAPSQRPTGSHPSE